MYRLTITQSDQNQPYIVYDAHDLFECTQILQQYKKDHNLDNFVDYDIIKVDEILVYSTELENLDFSDIKEEE